MGLRKALRLGITKGVQHTINPYKKLKSSAILSVLHCLDCGHASKSHTRRREEFVPMPREVLAKQIQETGFPGSMGFHECIFYHCDQCEEKHQAAKDAADYLKGCPI